MFVERDVNPVVWRNVLATYRDLRREAASQANARAIVKFALEAVSRPLHALSGELQDRFVKVAPPTTAALAVFTATAAREGGS
jgi:hypothetical protein